MNKKAGVFLSLAVIFIMLLVIGQASAAVPTDDFVITVKTDNTGPSSDTQFTMPTTGGGYNYDVDIDNDGTWDNVGITGGMTCVYVSAGTYTIRIRGTFPRICFNNGGDREKILTIEQWGTGVWTSMANAFHGCVHLEGNATDVPDLSSVEDMSDMFNTTSFNQDINNWDVSKVTDMRAMFKNAAVFNQPLGTWDVSKVTSMFQMFMGANSFNQPIGDWDTSDVTWTAYMFSVASSFNQPIGNWNTDKVTDMTSMFHSANAFDQNIGSWNVEALDSADDMFTNVTLSSFNYDALLVGWEKQNLQSSVTFGGGNSNYASTPAVGARTVIISNYGWTITDGGYLAPTPTYTATISPTVTPTPTASPTTTSSATATSTPTANPMATSTATPTANPVTEFTTTYTTTTIPTMTSTPDPLTFIDLNWKNALAYPNPAKDEVRFLLHLSNDARIQIDLYNIHGERVGQLREDRTAGRGQVLTWNCSGVSAGIYLAKIKINGVIREVLKVAVQ
jgi:surface protein